MVTRRPARLVDLDFLGQGEDGFAEFLCGEGPACPSENA